VDDLKVITGCDIDIVLSSEEEINKAIDTQYHTGSQGMEAILKETLLKARGRIRRSGAFKR